MKSPKTLAILVLALTTIGGAVLGWQQYQELVELRATAMNRDERADLQKRLWDLEKANKELQDQLAAARGGNPDDMFTTLDRPGGDNPRENRGGRGRGGPPNPQQQFEALRKVMSKPEVQALINVQQQAAIEARYAALFKNLGLTPEQRAKFESTVADFNATRMDILSAAREQGIRDPEEIRKLMAGAQDEFNNNLKSVLGDSGFAQYQTYEQTASQRNLVNQLQQRLSYTDNPLSSSQAEQLVGILAANPAPRPTNPDGTPQQTGRRGPPPDGGGGGGGPGFGGPGPGPGGDLGAIGAIVGGIGGDLLAGGRGGGGPTSGSATVTSAAINQAQGVLSQPQVTALQQIQQQQQTQQQLQQIVRDTLISTGPGNGPGGPGGPPASPGNRKRPGGD